MAPGPVEVVVEHLSVTVPDLDEAVDFFVRALGAVEERRATHRLPPESGLMAERFNAHPEAVAHLARLRVGGIVLEVFRYDAPDLDSRVPRNCDAGGHHLGFRVTDLEAAVATLATFEGVRILGEPTYGETVTGAARGWVYLLTPWGLQLELAWQGPDPAPAPIRSHDGNGAATDPESVHDISYIMQNSSPRGPEEQDS